MASICLPPLRSRDVLKDQLQEVTTKNIILLDKTQPCQILLGGHIIS